VCFGDTLLAKTEPLFLYWGGAVLLRKGEEYWAGMAQISKGDTVSGAVAGIMLVGAEERIKNIGGVGCVWSGPR